MAVELVEVVNPVTGLKGLVPITSPAAAAYRRPPSAGAGSTADPEIEEPVVEPIEVGPGLGIGQPQTAKDPGPVPEPELLANLGPAMPPKNASTEAWLTYATDPRTPNALSVEDAADLGRDDLVAHFNPTSEED